LKTDDAIKQLSLAQIDGWCRDLLGDEINLGSLKFLVTAYAVACQYGDPSDDDGGQKVLGFRNSSVFTRTITFVLKAISKIYNELAD